MGKMGWDHGLGSWGIRGEVGKWRGRGDAKLDRDVIVCLRGWKCNVSSTSQVGACASGLALYLTSDQWSIDRIRDAAAGNDRQLIRPYSIRQVIGHASVLAISLAANILFSPSPSRGLC